jgi:acyl-[acyl carrier protein]--UDP-N-acetylglucosamine O-acyltransferase
MAALRSVYDKLFDGNGTVQQKLEHLQTGVEQSPAVLKLLDFISAESTRSLCMPKSVNGRNAAASSSVAA